MPKSDQKGSLVSIIELPDHHLICGAFSDSWL